MTEYERVLLRVEKREMIIYNLKREYSWARASSKVITDDLVGVIVAEADIGTVSKKTWEDKAFLARKVMRLVNDFITDE